MSDESQSLGELLVRENLMSPKQLQTALDFQKSLGGDLRSILVKLGYVKDADIVALLARQEHVASTGDIDERVIDFKALEQLPRSLLEKHQIIPLRSDGHSIVLAMADPNNFPAIEEVQFLVNRQVEPAVASPTAIRKALSKLDEFKEAYAERSLDEDEDEVEVVLPVRTARGPKPISPERLKALKALPLEKLLRSWVLAAVERGDVTAEELLELAAKL